MSDAFEFLVWLSVVVMTGLAVIVILVPWVSFLVNMYFDWCEKVMRRWK